MASQKSNVVKFKVRKIGYRPRKKRTLLFPWKGSFLALLTIIGVFGVAGINRVIGEPLVTIQSITTEPTHTMVVDWSGGAINDPKIHYILSQSENDGFFTEVKNDIPYNQTNFTVTDLLPNTKYQFRVSVDNGAGSVFILGASAPRFTLPNTPSLSQVTPMTANVFEVTTDPASNPDPHALRGETPGRQ